MTPTAIAPKLLTLARSPIGKKLITGITGLGLTSFVVLHCVGNLLMFVSGDRYNAYGRFIEDLGPLLGLFELSLLAVVVVHAGYGLHLFLGRLRSRPIGYAQYASRGEPSLQSLSSRTMIVTGSIVAGFLVTHLLTFKFGPYYSTLVGDRPGRDLARLVLETFHKPAYTLGYTAVMVILGLHLRHGIWSALQSIGLMSRPVRAGLYGLSAVLAIAIAIGFLILPLSIYLGWVS